MCLSCCLLNKTKHNAKQQVAPNVPGALSRLQYLEILKMLWLLVSVSVWCVSVSRQSSVVSVNKLFVCTDAHWIAYWIGSDRHDNGTDNVDSTMSTQAE